MGFTLIEVLVTLTTFSLLLSLLSTNLSKIIEYNNLIVSVRLLVKDIKMCQYISMEEGVRTQILLDFTDNKYSLIRVEKLPRVFSISYLKDGVNFSWTNFTKKLIEFDPVGCPNMSDVGTPDKGGTIAIKSKSNRYLYVIITPVTGHVRISEKPP
ncbi:MAG: prepilin-type N-terminal cleavage/methylation domain-containing protein [bacterium]